MKTRHSIYFRLSVFLVSALLAVASVHLVLFLLRPPSSTKVFKEVLIPEGASFRAVATQLRQEGIITDKETFIALGRLLGITKKIRAGFYSLNTGMRPLDVLDYIKKGRIIEYQVVLPEGVTIDNVASILEGVGLADKSQFLAKATDPAYVRSLGLEGDTLEGYLFPATYYLPKGITLDGIIKRMASKYREIFNEDLKARAAALGMTEREVVVLASLIEKEAYLDSERMLISAVFHNRIKKGMALQCDSTIIYALQRRGGWNGDLTKTEMRMKNPYNSYLNKGLPPGPIANPGKPSMIAALYPANVDYIFFVSKNDGTHYFSSNFKDHNRAVQEYQVMAKMQNISSAEGPWKNKPSVPEPPKTR